ncbi:MAG: branched-chain amino acid ABC transporter substrate-binding protein [Bacteroidetes bacterium]|nr:branched-chain amino acid ABC transporter substrate-binding protein [Bacteroidota bacterium]
MPDSVTIGFELSNDDVYSVAGWCAAEMAIDQANAAGNLPVDVKLEVIVNGKDRDISRKAAADFVARKDAIAVLGPTNSAMAVISQDVYADAGILQMSSEASSPLLSNKGYTHFFRTVANDEVQGRALGQAAVNYIGGKRIAILNEDSAWGEPISKIFSDEITRLGVPPVLHFGYTEKERGLNYDDLIDAVVEAKPDLVYFAVYWNQTHIITHILRERGVDAVFLGSDALKPYAFLEVPSRDKEAPYHSLAGIDMMVKQSARQFLVDFAERYPKMLDAPQYAPEAYDCANMILECIRRAPQVTRSDVLREMQNFGTYSGALGEISFTPEGDLTDPDIGLYRCKDGQRVFVDLIKNLV